MLTTQTVTEGHSSAEQDHRRLPALRNISCMRTHSLSPSSADAAPRAGSGSLLPEGAAVSHGARGETRRPGLGNSSPTGLGDEQHASGGC